MNETEPTEVTLEIQDIQLGVTSDLGEESEEE